MSGGGQIPLEVFQLNKHSKQEDLEQCISWLRVLFSDSSMRSISIVVKRNTAFAQSSSAAPAKDNSLLSLQNTIPKNEFVLNQSDPESFAVKSLEQSSGNTHSPKNQKENSSSINFSNAIASNFPQDESTILDNRTKKQTQSPENSPYSNQSRPQNPSRGRQDRIDSYPSRISEGNSFTSTSSRPRDENDAFNVSDKARTLYLNQQFEEALVQFQRSSDSVKDDSDPVSLKLFFQNKIYIGSIYAQQRERKKAITELNEALKLSEGLDTKSMEQQSDSLSNKEHAQKYINSNPIYFIHLTLGNLNHEEQNLDIAIYHLEKAFSEISKETSAIEMKSQALVLNTLGMIYYSKNLISTSIEKFKSSLSILSHIMSTPEGSNDKSMKVSYANRLNNLGEAYRRDQQIMLSIQNFQESLRLKIEAQAESGEVNHESLKSIASTQNNLGTSYYGLKKMDEAIYHFDQAIEKYESILEISEGQQDTLGYANILNQRGDCYKNKQNFIQAADDYKKSLDLKVKVLGEQHKSTVLSLRNYAQTLFSAKKFTQSKESFLDLLRIQKSIYGENDSNVAQTLNNIGTVLSENQEFDEAEEMINHAIKIYSSLPSNEVNLEKVQKNLNAIQTKKRNRQIKNNQQ